MKHTVPNPLLGFRMGYKVCSSNDQDDVFIYVVCMLSKRRLVGQSRGLRGTYIRAVGSQDEDAPHVAEVVECSVERQFVTSRLKGPQVDAEERVLLMALSFVSLSNSRGRKNPSNETPQLFDANMITINDIRFKILVHHLEACLAK